MRRPPGKAIHYRGVADWWGGHVWVERDGIRAALSERYYRDFVHEVLAHLPEPEFVLGRDEILAWIAERPGQTTA